MSGGAASAVSSTTEFVEAQVGPVANDQVAATVRRMRVGQDERRVGGAGIG